MRRREFVTLLGGAATGWPLAARAQQITKLPTIGFMGSATSSVSTPWVNAFVERLRAHDWTEGRTVRPIRGAIPLAGRRPYNPSLSGHA
jgi:putative ABC transport system substrate-binding protein